MFIYLHATAVYAFTEAPKKSTLIIGEPIEIRRCAIVVINESLFRCHLQHNWFLRHFVWRAPSMGAQMLQSKHENESHADVFPNHRDSGEFTISLPLS